MDLGSLRYAGWRNLRVAVPASLPFYSNVLPRSTTLTTFVKFRIWTNPGERTAVSRDRNGNIIPFNVYFSQLKVLSDVYQSFYDGEELSTQKKTEELWGASGQ